MHGLFNRRQQQIIAFQKARIEARLEHMGKTRLFLSDDQRRQLAVEGHTPGRKSLLEQTTIVTPNSGLFWHRELLTDNVGMLSRHEAGTPRQWLQIVLFVSTGRRSV
ncbi:MAG: hypothetical protein ABGZ17_29495 [Planctomycetaceae bacterium]